MREPFSLTCQKCQFPNQSQKDIYAAVLQMIGANQQQAHIELAQLRERATQVWSEGALRLIFERSPNAILLLDDGVFIDCNQAAVEMLLAPTW